MVERVLSHKRKFAVPAFLTGFLGLWFALIFFTIATFFLPDPWSLEILNAQGALDWNRVVIYTFIGIIFLGFAAYLVFAGVVKRRHMV